MLDRRGMKHGSVDGRVLRRGTHSRRSVSGALYLAMRGKRTEKKEKGGEHAKRVCGGGEGSVCGAFRWARESENERDSEKKKNDEGGLRARLFPRLSFPLRAPERPAAAAAYLLHCPCVRLQQQLTAPTGKACSPARV